MKIGLIDADSHNFPNLALMKISAFFKDANHDVDFLNVFDSYDRVYVSKVFTWSPNPLRDYSIKSPIIAIGGTGWSDDDRGYNNFYFEEPYKELSDEIEHFYPDYSLYPGINYALGYLTRGCPRNCDFCIVNSKEGNTHLVADLGEFWKGQKEIKLLDPNLLAYIDAESVLQQLINSKANIDFTQGLDIRLLVDKYTINLVKKIRIKRIHFAYDEMKNQGIIEAALLNFKKHTGWGRNKVSVYILTNYNTTFDEDMQRIEFCKSIDFSPYVMIYDKHKLEPGSIYYKLQKWANNPMFLYTNTFQNFVKTMYRTSNQAQQQYKQLIRGIQNV